SAPWRPEIDNDRQIVLQEFIQRCPGRVDDVAVKKIVTAASALCAIRATIVREAVQSLTTGTNGIHN
ncbi:hypothetical protein QE238_19600, partial [Klebsiella pneumoniae]